MYLWVGAVFDSESENEIRTVANKLNEEYRLSTVAFSLPQHISLKISFECDDYKKVIAVIKSQLKTISPFVVEIKDITKIDGSLIWLDINENVTLRKIHNLLNTLLLDTFDIPLKSFDGEDFKFHSTLFFDNQIDNIHQALIDKLKKEYILPKEYSIKEINFGIAESVRAGKFTVVDTLILK